MQCRVHAVIAASIFLSSASLRPRSEFRYWEGGLRLSEKRGLNMDKFAYPHRRVGSPNAPARSRRARSVARGQHNAHRTPNPVPSGWNADHVGEDRQRSHPEATQMPALRAFMSAFVSVVNGVFGSSPDVLADFGIPASCPRPYA